MSASQRGSGSPPPGYKSAIGKARDATKAAAERPPKKVASLADRGDTASEDDLSDGEGILSFEVKSLRPYQEVRPGPPRRMCSIQPSSICAVNKFESLSDFDDVTLKDLNNWAHKINISSTNINTQQNIQRKVRHQR